MEQGLTTEWFQKIFTFPFQDEKWKEKFLIGSLLALPSLLLPIIPAIFLYGYFAEIMRGIINDGKEPFLPEWDQWGEILKDGLKLFLVGLLLASPLIILFIASQVLMVFFPISLEITGMNVDPDSPFWIFIPLLSVFGSMGMMGISTLLSLFLGFLSPVIYGHIIATGELSAAVRVKEWWQILKANWAGYLIGFILILFTGFIMMFVMQIIYMTVILCCLIPFIMSPITFYLTSVAGAVFGETYKVGSKVQDSKTDTVDPEEVTLVSD